MRQGWRWGALIGLGCASPVTKAERALDRFADGHTVAWHEARYAVESAVLDPSSSEDPRAWALRGQVYLTQLGNPALSGLDTDPVELSLKSYEAATELGAGEPLQARMRSEVPELEAVVQQRLSRHIDARNWSVAAHELSLAQRIHRINLTIGTGDVQREVALRRLASQVEAEAGDALRAADHYEALVAITRTHEMPLVLDVILALSDRGQPDRARALATLASDAMPNDFELFELMVQLTLEGGDVEGARDAVDRRRADLTESVEGSVLAAVLYERAGAQPMARMLWSRVIELSPGHYRARLALGRSLSDHAGTLTHEWTPPPSETDAALLDANLAVLWREAEDHLRRAHDLEPTREAPLRALLRLYEQKWAHVDPTALDEAARAAFDADLRRSLAVRAQLDLPAR